MKIRNEIFNKWLASPFIDEAMHKEMLAMTEEQVAASFKSDPIKFGTAGYRAITGPGPLFLNKFTYQQLTVGYARYVLKMTLELKNCKCPKVIIAHDNRQNGDKFALFITHILTAHGIEVYLLPNNIPIATPFISYLIRSRQFDGGINITASHNPKEYNGFKAYNNLGAQLTEEQAEALTKHLPDQFENLSMIYNANPKLMHYIEYTDIDNYFNDINRHLKINKYAQSNVPVVFTAHHGACSLFTINFLKSQGHNIIGVDSQCFLDPSFVNSPIMNPEDPKSFIEAEKIAKNVKAKIMLGVDPDGDRLAVAVKHNNEWVYLNGNQTGILATNYLLKYGNCNGLVPVVISTYVTNNLINKIVEKYDGIVLRTGTGFKNIALAMEQIEPEHAKFIIGFEEAIGMCISDSIREKDGNAAAALVLEMVNFYLEKNMDLVDVLEKQIFPSFGYWYGETVSITIPGNNWKTEAQKLEKKTLSIETPLKLNNLTVKEVFWNEMGQCIEWQLANDSWIKFRISGTEPKFKIYYNLYFDKDQNKTPYNMAKYKTCVAELTQTIKTMLFAK